MEEDDIKATEELRESYALVLAECGKAIQGQREVLEKLFICIFAQGHGLLMGVPGLAKTLMVQSISRVLDLSFSRIQFTPDMMPSDITGTDILQEQNDQPGRRAFEFIKGPVFANLVLADEINRTPPKTQAALLQAMQEREVSVFGRHYKLDDPFFVLATQNPIEQEGTYPLPEAQLDRFMFFIQVDYLSFEEELQMSKSTTGSQSAELETVVSKDKLLSYQKLVRRVPVPDHIYEMIVALVRKTRPGEDSAPDWIKEVVSWGAGPRAIQYLILGAKTRAVLQGSYLVRMEDVVALAEVVLPHRLQLNFHAESQGMTPQKIISRLVAEMAQST